MTHTDLELRRLAFEVSVRHDLDLTPLDDGIALEAWGSTVPWPVVARAIRDAAPQSEAARLRLYALLADITVIANLPADELGRRARPLGLPVGASDHPGPEWVRVPVLGGAIDLGLGLLGVRENPDRVEPLSPLACEVTGTETQAWWSGALTYLESMGALAAKRLTSDPAPEGRQATLRPIGDADVVTLLGSRAFRTSLAVRDSGGMCSIAVPMRRRGWVDLRQLDPAFIPAAAATIDDAQRGFSRPLLVTADEVVVAEEARA